MSVQSPVAVYCDFDGTITVGDTVDFILEQLADPEWREIEARWVAGEIGSRDCMAWQFELIRGGWARVEKLLAEVKLEPDFADFARWCRQRSFPLTVVSEGPDRVISHLLNRDGIRVDAVWANHLEENGRGGLRLSFPLGPLDGDCRAGLCKCRVLGDSFNVIIGDGLSDACWARFADLLFAKNKLLEKYQHTHPACYRLTSFEAVRRILEENLQKTARGSKQLFFDEMCAWQAGTAV